MKLNTHIYIYVYKSNLNVTNFIVYLTKLNLSETLLKIWFDATFKLLFMRRDENSGVITWPYKIKSSGFVNSLISPRAVLQLELPLFTCKNAYCREREHQLGNWVCCHLSLWWLSLGLSTDLIQYFSSF